MKAGWRLAAALVVVLGSPAAAAGAGRIAVRERSVVEGRRVRLGEIASLSGDARALSGLELGPAPAPGGVRTFEGKRILRALAAAGADLDALRYRIPARVRVRRASQELGEEDFRRIVEEFLAGQRGGEEGEVVLRGVELPGPVRLPAGDLSWEVSAPSGVPLVGRVRLAVELGQGGRRLRTVWVTADIARYGELFVLRRPLARGERIAASDLVAERRDLSRLPRGTVTRASDLVGKQARSALRPGVPLRRDQIGEPALVHRGDVVLLVAERGPLRITTLGEAREDAAGGQQVRVVNRTSRREVVGRVVDGSTVEVEF